MTIQQQMPCPTCNQPIHFDPHGLIKGEKFQCGNCFAIVGIAADSLQTAKEALDQFNDLKQNMGQQKQSYS